MLQWLLECLNPVTQASTTRAKAVKALGEVGMGIGGAGCCCTRDATGGRHVVCMLAAPALHRPLCSCCARAAAILSLPLPLQVVQADTRVLDIASVQQAVDRALQVHLVLQQGQSGSTGAALHVQVPAQKRACCEDGSNLTNTFHLLPCRTRRSACARRL